MSSLSGRARQGKRFVSLSPMVSARPGGRPRARSEPRGLTALPGSFSQSQLFSPCARCQSQFQAFCVVPVCWQVASTQSRPAGRSEWAAGWAVPGRRPQQWWAGPRVASRGCALSLLAVTACAAGPLAPSVCATAQERKEAGVRPNSLRECLVSRVGG